MATLPTRLRKEPLVDALFEIRFTTRLPAIANVLPGMIFSKLANESNIPLHVERLPIADLPIQMRNSDPFLRFQPQVRVLFDGFNILIGDFTLNIGCKMPYPGWSEFKPRITSILDLLFNTKLIEKIERYSLKYVDVIDDNDLPDRVRRSTVRLSIADHEISSETFSVRIELPRSDYIHVVQVVSSATATISSGESRTGLLIDVDTIATPNITNVQHVIENIDLLLNNIHEANKAVFFDCISQEALEYLEPIYEQ